MGLPAAGSGDAPGGGVMVRASGFLINAWDAARRAGDVRMRLGEQVEMKVKLGTSLHRASVTVALLRSF